MSTGPPNTVYGTTNTDAGVGIGMLTGDSNNLIKKAINLPSKTHENFLN